jgi:iron complex outermembrane receptor protein
VDSFETGLRGSWFDGRFGLDASLFYYAYENYQIFTAQQLSGSPPQFLILNANDAEVYGMEADAVTRPWEGGFLNVRFSWLESQFLDFVQRDQFLKAQTGTQIAFRERQASGNPLLNSPRFKVSLTAEQTVPVSSYGSLTLRYDGVWTDSTFYDSSAGQGLGDEDGDQFLPDGTIGQGPFWLHNLRLSWRHPNGHIEVAGWVRNLENTSYKTFAFDGSNFQATTIYFVGDPRTYGISLAFNF